MAYIAGPKEPGCIFCTQPQAEDRRAALVLALTPAAVVMMNRFPYASGHIMVAPRRHTADPMELEPAEYGDLCETLRQGMALLREEMAPQGMNVGLNLGAAAGAGVQGHLHWHIVPRWVGDTNFMPLFSEVRVIPEHLESLFDRLRVRFRKLERAEMPGPG